MDEFLPGLAEIKEMADRRLEVCKSCDKLGAFNRCELCGCFVQVKVMMRSESCPDGLWKEEK